MKKQPPVVHIGFAKAASTYLQNIFHAHPNIFYPERGETVSIFCDSELYFDYAKSCDYVKTKKEEAGSKRLVFSHERLAGNPHSGFYDCASVAKRLAVTVPNARIIIAIREQYSMIASCYKQYVRIGGTKTFSEYVLPLQDFRIPRFNYKIFKYLEFIKLYQKLFGVENVLVVPIEDLRICPQETINYLFEFMGIESMNVADHVVNKGIPEEKIDEMRRQNIISPLPSSLHDFVSIRPKLLSKIVAMLKNDSTLFAQQAQQIIGHDYFNRSNQILSELLNINLKKRGYSV